MKVILELVRRGRLLILLSILMVLLGMRVGGAETPAEMGQSQGRVKEEFFTVKTDHHANAGADARTFDISYLVDDTYFSPEEGCILFYAGGYTEIWSYYKKSGFVTTELAKELRALVIFGEHRYFG